MPRIIYGTAIPAVILLISGIIGLIRPELGWEWHVGRWVDRDAEPSESYLLRRRVTSVVTIIMAIALFIAGTTNAWMF